MYRALGSGGDRTMLAVKVVTLLNCKQTKHKEYFIHSRTIDFK